MHGQCEKQTPQSKEVRLFPPAYYYSALRGQVCTVKHTDHPASFGAPQKGNIAFHHNSLPVQLHRKRCPLSVVKKMRESMTQSLLAHGGKALHPGYQGVICTSNKAHKLDLKIVMEERQLLPPFQYCIHPVSSIRSNDIFGHCGQEELSLDEGLTWLK
ncbi:hypothetical protein PRIC2_009283 [Phytophthora ramorum]